MEGRGGRQVGDVAAARVRHMFAAGHALSGLVVDSSRRDGCSCDRSAHLSAPTYVSICLRRQGEFEGTVPIRRAPGPVWGAATGAAATRSPTGRVLLPVRSDSVATPPITANFVA